MKLPNWVEELEKNPPQDELVTQGEIATKTGLSRRSVIRWLGRLGILPSRFDNGLNMYHPQTIRRVREEQERAYRERANLIRAAIKRRHGKVITTTEAKRRAGKRGAR